MTKENSANYYLSRFSPDKQGLTVLRNGGIIREDETPQEMVNRVVNDIVSIEVKFGTPIEEISQLAAFLGTEIDRRRILLGTPIMTNAGIDNQPLSACSVPPVNLQENFSKTKEIIDTYHQEAMGTGFTLTDVDNPVATLLLLNDIAVRGSNSGRERRPVGNMAVCRIDHPKIEDFITIKMRDPDRQWKFNLSVDIPRLFWEAVKTDGFWTLRDDNQVKARELFHLIATCACACGEPGIILMERLNDSNPTPGLGLYQTTAPCAEVGLIPGETCQFGYLNLSEFVDITGTKIVVNYENLAGAARLLVRVLDDALELSISRYKVDQSRDVMKKKRKIGVGVCGLADMLLKLKIPYDSDQGRRICQNIISFINYQTKVASQDLARVRGSFEAMTSDCGGCRYNDNPGFIEQKYSHLLTDSVSSQAWLQLADSIRRTKLLRNCSTTALPPTGRSSLVIGASPSIEPLFSLVVNGEIHPLLLQQLSEICADTPDNLKTILLIGSCQSLDVPQELKDIFRTSAEITPIAHLKMTAAIQSFTDESVSKTINLPSDTTPEQIEELYLLAYKIGLKGITIYRDGSRNFQPIRLSQR